MDPETYNQLQVKPLDEILARVRDLIHRHRRKFLKKYLRPSPNNCTKAIEREGRVVGCRGCGSRNPETCLRSENFVPFETKDQLYQAFTEELRDWNVLAKDYRDIAMLLWVIGAFDSESVDEQVLSGVDKRKDS